MSGYVGAETSPGMRATERGNPQNSKELGGLSPEQQGALSKRATNTEFY